MRDITRAVENAFQVLLMKADREGKHVISTSSIKEYIPPELISGLSGDTDTAYLAQVGLGQVIQSILWRHDFRSLGRGFFVNLEQCDNVSYLAELYNNSDSSVLEKETIRKRIKSKCDGQGVFSFEGDRLDYDFNMTEEEFYEYVREDAV